MDKRIKDAVNELIKTKEKVVVAIEGGCTSGKTTLAQEIKKEFDCNVFHTDDFFLPFEKRTENRMKETGGNIDYERFKKEIADNIRKNCDFSYGKFDCGTGKISETITVKNIKLNIIEGVYSLHPEYDNIYDLKIFLEIEEDEQIKRLKLRSPEKLTRFIKEWIPKENEYFKAFDIKSRCDIVL